MKKFIQTRILPLALAVVCAFTAIIFADEAKPTFTDVPTTFWAYSDIEKCAAEGIVVGVGNNRFDPNATLTYAQFYTLIARAFYNEEVKARQTELDTWYSANIAVLYEKKLLENNESAAPSLDLSDAGVAKGISRYDMSVLMYNIAKQYGSTDSWKNVDSRNIKDLSNMAPYYATQVRWCYAEKLLNGYTDGQFHGDDTVTRAQACAIVCRLTKYTSGKNIVEEPEKQGSEVDASRKLSTLSYAEAAAALKVELTRQIEEYRAELGLNKCDYLLEIDEATKIRAEEVSENFSHDRPDGTGWATTYRDLYGAGFGTGEILCKAAYISSYTVEQEAKYILDAWKKSPGHDYVLREEDAIYMVVNIKCKAGFVYSVAHFSDQASYDMFLKVLSQKNS